MVKKQIRVPEGIITGLLVIYLLYNIPIVPHYISTVFFVFPTALLLLCLFLHGSVNKGVGAKFLLASFAFLALLLMDEVFVEASIVHHLWNLLLKYIPLIAGYFLVEYEFEKTTRIFVATVMLSYILTCITTYIGLQKYPDASRDLASGTNADFYGKMNIGGFDYIYSLAISHPAFVYYLRKKEHPMLAVLISLLFAVCVIEARYTIALGVFAASLLCYFIPVKDGRRLKKGITWMIPVSLVAIFVLAPEILDYLAKQELFEGFSEKLLDISRMLQGKNVQQNNTELRQKVYAASWEAFLRHPIIGNRLIQNGSTALASGGHSFLLDTMGKWGLIGISIVLAMVWAFSRWYRSLFVGSYAYYYSLFSLGLSLVVAALNPVFWSYELGMIIPLFAYCAIYCAQKKKTPPFLGVKIRWK